MSKNHKTSAMYFAAFKGAAKYFVDKFGLKCWQVAYHHVDDPEMPDSRASCRYTTASGQQASLRLPKTWGHDEPNMHKVTLSSFHETMHLLFANLNNIAVWDDLSRQQRDEALRREEHKIIRVLEDVVFPLMEPEMVKHLQETINVGRESDMQ